MKYKFEVIYCPEPMQKALDLMRAMDLELTVGLSHTLTFSSSKDLSISEVKAHITAAYEADGCVVLDVKGGVFE